MGENKCNYNPSISTDSTTTAPPTGDSSQTTAPHNTETTALCDDPSVDIVQCPEESQDGCSLTLSLEVDVCILNTDLIRNNIYEYFKHSTHGIVKSVNGWESKCVDAQFAVTNWELPRDKNGNTGNVGLTPPNNKDECKDIDVFCAGDKDLEFTLSGTVSMFCGTCDDQKDLMGKILETINSEQGKDIFDQTFLDESIEGDTLCLGGVGAVELNSATLAVYDEDGNVYKDSIVDIKSSAISKGYYVGIVFIVFALFSLL